MDRTDPDLRADERTSLDQFLDFHRATLISRIEGLTIEQLAITRPPSELTLAGLIKHLALVEDSWFVERMAGRPMPEPWLSAPFDDDPDWDFHSAVDDTPEHDDLDALSVVPSRSDEGLFSLRWILLHMIEETARHNGHADLLRESIDGLTGE